MAPEKNLQPLQDLLERALEESIETLDIVATDEKFDRRLRDVQALCQKALIELRGFGHEIHKEEWQKEV